MSMIKEIIAAAVDSNVPTTQVLRMARVAAVNAGTPEFQAWLDLEAKGYAGKRGREIPPYRHVQGALLAHYPQGWAPVRARTVELQQIADKFAATPISHPLTEIEGLSKGGDLVMIEYAGEQESVVLKFLPRATKVGIEVAAGQLRRIAEHVRDAILEWALQLDRTGAESGGTFTPDEKERAAAVAPTAQNFTTNFYGPLKQVQVQQGSAGASQTMTVGDLDGVASVVRALRESVDEIRFKDEERQELEANLKVLELEIQAPRPGAWAIRKALSTIWTLGSGVASSHLAAKYGIQIDHLIQSFMGML